MDNEEKFNYSYAAPNQSERREIENIKKQYLEPLQNEDKLEQLRDLNRRAVQPPQIAGLTVGIVGTLVMGLGMAMVLEWSVTLWGSIVGGFGAIVAGAAYPLYRCILKRNKRRYGRQIIDLSDELLNISGDR